MIAKISFDTKNTGPDIDPMIFGHFIENMGRSIYRGGLLSREGKVREDVVSALEQMGASMVRWPGGLFADGYHWQDGIGENRPLKPNLYWKKLTHLLGPKDPNYFGTHEFMDLCRRLDSVPYINVNLGTGKKEEAAAWVQYCNGKTDTPYGSLRAKNGREKPWNVNIWGIGNETFGWWAFGHSDPKTYGKRYLEFYEAMAAEDPFIQGVAVGTSDDMPQWNPKLLSVIGDKAAYLSFHIYLPAINKPQYFVMRLNDNARNHYALASAFLELNRKIQFVADQIKQELGPKSQMKIALDEWNLWWWWPQAYKVWWRMRDAVSVAGMAGAMVENCHILKVGNIAQAINVLGLLHTNYHQVVKTPLFYVMELFHSTIRGAKLDLKVESPIYDSVKLGGIPAANNVPLVSAHGSIKGKEVGLIIIQRRYESSQKIRIDTPGVNLNKVKILSGPTPGAINDFKNPDRVGIVEKSVENGNGGTELLLPAASVAALTGTLV